MVINLGLEKLLPQVSYDYIMILGSIVIKRASSTTTITDRNKKQNLCLESISFKRCRIRYYQKKCLHIKYRRAKR
jgi:hypothetical protein